MRTALVLSPLEGERQSEGAAPETGEAHWALCAMLGQRALLGRHPSIPGPFSLRGRKRHPSIPGPFSLRGRKGGRTVRSL